METTPRTRRVERIHLAQPLVAKLGSMEVVVVDISILGARIEHHMPIPSGGRGKFTFRWDGTVVATNCRVVRSRLARFSVGSDGLTIYHSGLEFDDPPPESLLGLKRLIEGFITRALEEQKLNARGELPADVANMPIFRYGGQLTANVSDVATAVGGSSLPISRIAKETGYICYQLDQRSWREKQTHDPGQPLEGFTISAMEDRDQAVLLCDAYEKADRDGRRLIQLFAQLSIVEGEGVTPGRFDP